jgi:hypothetical protein
MYFIVGGPLGRSTETRQNRKKKDTIQIIHKGESANRSQMEVKQL